MPRQWAFGTRQVRSQSSAGAVHLLLPRRQALFTASCAPAGTSFDTWDFINAGGLCYTLMFSGWERRLRFPAHGQVVSIKRRTALRKFDGKGYYLMAAGAGTGDEQDVEAVVKPVLALADKEGLPAITESDTPARKALLEGLGFKAVDSVAALSVGVEIMLRQPSAV